MKASLKKLSAIMMTTVMTFTAATQGFTSLGANSSGEGDPWTSNAVNWKAAEAVSSEWASEDEKFTYEEYTGNTSYADKKGNTVRASDVTAINTVDAHATASSAPYDTVETAIIGARDYKKEDSKYVQMLTGEEGGEWDLTVVQNMAQAKPYLEAGVTDPDYDIEYSGIDGDGWNSVMLPSSWTSYGYDFTIYTNTQMPWQTKYDSGVTVPNAPVNYNPVGFYRKEFVIDDSMLQDNGKVFLSFQGVESAYYVYLNGLQVGYAEDSYRPSEFDVTDYLNPKGETNTLVVQVHKFCDGTWLEDQDMLYDGGIFRDVYLYSTPYVHISDYTVVTELDSAYTNATLQLSVDVTNYSVENYSNLGVDARLYDEDGTNILNGDALRLDIGSVNGGNVETQAGAKFVKEPKLWSAETPNLYTLVLTLYDKSTGQYYESLSQQLGFRQINFTSTEVDSNYNRTTTEYQTMTINGMPVLLKGTNRHDRDPFSGKYISKEVAETDITLMKQYNLNALRTSHYPNDEYIYYLCDKYGIYVMGETNAESHALMNDPGSIGNYFTELLLDRTNTHLQNLKNQTSVIMWSIGNEMAYTTNGGNNIFPKMIWYFKNNDPTRPVHSEGQFDNGGVDMASNMYPWLDHVSNQTGLNKIPYVMCEYAHAMGNAVGGLNDYWEIVRSSENMIGGFIWDWVDQSMVVSLGDLDATYSLTEGSSNHASGVLYGQGIVNADSGSLTGKAADGYTIMDSSNNSLYNSYLTGNNSFTFEVIVKPNSEANNSVFLSKGDQQVALKTTSTGKGIEFFYYNSSSQWGNAVSVSSFPDNWVDNWHQIVGIYDKDNNRLQLYIDGELAATKNGLSGTPASTTNELAVGYDTYSNGRQVDGNISLARVYTTALTQDQIKAQYSTSPSLTQNSDEVLLWLDYSQTELTTVETSYWDYYSEDYAKSYLYKDEMPGYFFGMGGDWGDVPNDTNFAQNGLISPDRTPQPEMEQVKYVYQNFWFTADTEMLSSRQVSVYNESNFINLNEYTVKWELVEDGEVYSKGTLDNLNVAPRETKNITVPFTMPSEKKAGAEYYLNVYVELNEDTLWAEIGHEIAHEQIEIPADIELVPIPQYNNDVAIAEAVNGNIEVKGSDFEFFIDGDTGTLMQYVYDGELLIEEGPTPSFWRGRLNNDATGEEFNGNWKDANKDIALQSFAIDTNTDGRPVIKTVLNLPNGGGATLSMDYTINSNGEVTVDYNFNASASSFSNGSYGGLLSIGTELIIPEGYEQLTWYGNGPVESYQDRKDFAMQGIYSETVTDMFYPFLQAQDTGRLTDVKWISLENDDNNYGIMVAGSDVLEASALHFSNDDLDNAYHPYDLVPRDETVLGIDMISQGNGNKSCGPPVFEGYRLWKDIYKYQFTIVPYDIQDDDPMELSKPYRTIAVSDDLEDNSPAQVVINMIDQFIIYKYDQINNEVPVLESAYNDLTAEQQKEVDDARGANAVADIRSAVEELANKDLYFVDQSTNSLDPVADTSVLSLNYDAKFGTAMSGYLSLANTKGQNGGDIFNDVIGGTKPFTLEAVIYASGSSLQYNMIMGKGDRSFGFRSRSGSYLDFFIYNGSGWKSVEATIPSQIEWANNWHHVVGTYDGTTLSFYIDGIEATGDKYPITDTTGPSVSDYDLYIGHDADTLRYNDHKFASAKVYSKSLSEDEIKAQMNYEFNGTAPVVEANDDDVVVWIDFSKFNFTTNLKMVNLTPQSAAGEPGEAIDFEVTLPAGSDDIIIDSVEWSVVNALGNIPSDASIVIDGQNPAKATLNISEEAKPGSTYRVLINGVNGKSTVTAQAVVTISDEEVSVVGISLNADNLEFAEGQDYGAILVPIFEPANASNQNVTWESDNENVVTVNGGIVVVQGPGTATITVTADDGGYKAFCNVKVTGDETIIPVTGINLDKEISVMFVGETDQLTAEVLPENATDKTLTWSSSNPDVLAVEDGLLTAISAGEAVITVTAVNGVKTTCTIRVEDKEIVDKSKLEYYINELIAAMEHEEYDGLDDILKSKASLALSEARTVFNNGEATQKQVTDAVAAIEQVLAEIPYLQDKYVLIQAIAKAAPYAEEIEKYTDSTAKTFTEALENAQKVLANESSTKEDYETAAKALNDAVSNLQLKVVLDYTDLAKAIDYAENTIVPDLDSYEEAGKTEFNNALASAKAVYRNAETQAEIDNAVKALEAAIAGLVKIPAVPDKSELEAAINDAKGYDDSDVYTEESLKTLQDAVANAEKVLADPEAGADMIANAIKDIQDAIDGLEKLGEETEPTGSTEPGEETDPTDSTDPGEETDPTGSTGDPATDGESDSQSDTTGSGSGGKGGSSSGSSGKSSAKTGDSAPIILLAVLLLASVSGILVLQKKRKK